MVTFSYDPVGYAIIQNPADDQGDLIICHDLFMDKIIFTGVLMMVSEMLPVVRIGTLEGEVCSTEAMGVLEGILRRRPNR